MLTNHKPSRMASKEVQAAALVGGMGKLISPNQTAGSRAGQNGIGLTLGKHRQAEGCPGVANVNRQIGGAALTKKLNCAEGIHRVGVGTGSAHKRAASAGIQLPAGFETVLTCRSKSPTEVRPFLISLCGSLRLCASALRLFSQSTLQWAYVRRESGSEKLRYPSGANSAVKPADAQGYPRQASSFALLHVLCAFALILLPGCVSAHKKGRTIHERFDYAISQRPGCDPVALLICHEIWKDEWTGGGRAFLADPKASELVSLHTNQSALGGSSTLTIGAFESQVSTNGITAAGHATGEIIQDVGAAAGQLINKSVTGNPLK